MKLIEYFRIFLTDTVNLNKTRLDHLDDRVLAITSTLKGSQQLDGRILDTVPQGSWAHQTIIRPADGLEFDADFLVELAEDSSWANSPISYANAVRDALKASALYAPKLVVKDRCVRVVYANDCHVDVVPSVRKANERTYILNRSTKEFEETNGVGFTAWLQGKDDVTGGDLRRVLRLLKYLRDHRGAFKIKSVLLTTMVGNIINDWHMASKTTNYKDVPTTLVNLVTQLDSWLQLHLTKPIICDPSCPYTTFDHRWTEAQYLKFRNDIHDLAPRLRAAYDAGTAGESITAWTDIFGDKFPRSTSKRALAASAASVAKAGRAPGELFIEEKFRVDLLGTVTISCDVVEKVPTNRAQRRQHVQLRQRAGFVAKRHELTFRVVATNIAEPFDVYWKVRNHGLEAQTRGHLRGQIVRDNGRRTKTEQTLYAGHHYVECYLVKDGLCVARAHEDVIIN